MNGKLKTFFRVLAFSVVLAAATFGYVCYEKTLVEWWLPVLASAILALLTLPFFSVHWRILTGMKGAVNYLCHLYVVGGIGYFLLLGGNFLFSAPSSACKEEVRVLEKEHLVKNVTSRSGRRYRTVRRTIHYYYLTVCFADGTCKKVPVSLSLYNRSHKDGVCIFTLQRGLLGFRVIK
ncbi:MAG: hypothetical protein NC206_11555 [Bacteroides sp.]|nr:hypothetical protein [Roseburia sp.]MCM1347703.1 hypothetical protein [Bacteroides sp.]MCM1422123.1 hypothetical protein [Bacteroides sp.]